MARYRAFWQLGMVSAIRARAQRCRAAGDRVQRSSGGRPAVVSRWVAMSGHFVVCLEKLLRVCSAVRQLKASR